MDIRKRVKNFTTGEEDQLMQLVKKYSSIIECKKSNSIMNRDKNEAWKNIEKQFNSNSSIGFRDAKALRVKYENLKKHTKRKYADVKTHLRGTGGGPPCTSIMSSRDIEIQDILGCRITGLTSEYDADSQSTILESELLQSDPQSDDIDESNAYIPETQTCLQSFAEESVLETTIEESREEKDIVTPLFDDHSSPILSNFVPSKLKTSVNDKLKVAKYKSKSTVEAKISTWAAAKLDLQDLQRKGYLQELEEKIRHLKEMNCLQKKHTLEMNELTRNFIKQEQALKLQLLELQIANIRK